MEIDLEKLKWQENVVEKWKQIGGKGWLSLPPGIGKSFIAVIAIKQLLNNVPNASVMIVVPKNHLAEQWSIKYIDTLRKQYPESIIHLRTVQSIFRRTGFYNFIIWDELHKYVNGEQFSKVFTNFKAVGQLGLSGSVSPEIYQKLKIMGMQRVIHMSRKEAIDLKFLTPTYVYNIGIKPSYIEEMRLAKLTNTIEKESLKLAQIPCFEILNPSLTNFQKSHIIRKTRMGWNETFGIAMKVQRAIIQRNDIVDNHPQKIEIFKEFATKFNNKQILTFSKFTNFANLLTSCFPEESKSYHSNISGIVVDNLGNVLGQSIKEKTTKTVNRKKTTSTKTKYEVDGNKYEWSELKKAYPNIHFKRVSPKVVKQQVLDDFIAKRIRIINSAVELQEGLDIPSIDACYEASRTNSTLTLIQEAGRLRKAGGIFLRAYLDTEYSSDKRKIYQTQEEGDIDGIDIQSVSQINV